ncbi:MAG: hypothetical protein FJ317_00295 [SAR202 cluster bacterium]|nr:hypothetical protein [SAR202 cluster bacterium]
MTSNKSPEERMPAEKAAALKKRMRLGLIVFAGLIVLEIVEYVLGVTIKRGSWPILMILAIIGSWPIVHYYMHVTQLWKRDHEE